MNVVVDDFLCWAAVNVLKQPQLLVNADELTGGNWITTEEGHHIYMKDGVPIAGNPNVLAALKGEVHDGGSDGSGRGPSPRGVKGAGGRMAREAQGSRAAGAGKGRQGEDQPPRDEATKAAMSRIDRYTKVFAAKGNDAAAEFMGMLHEHIGTHGAEHAAAALGVVRQGGHKGDVQYEGAYDELGDTKQEGKFIEEYLKRAGIRVVHSDADVDRRMPHVSTWTEANLKEQGRSQRTEKKGDYLAKDASFANDKLKESKLLHGDAKAEDLGKLMGKPVTNLTPEVLSSLDKKYGKGGWIVKSYGEEAYAGFGVIFSQRAAQVKSDAKVAIQEGKDKLKKNGYKVARGEAGVITGVSDGKKITRFGTPEFDKLPKGVLRAAKQVQQAAPNEHGMRMPRNSEDVLQNDYGMTLKRGKDGVPNGVIDRDGREHALDSKHVAKFEEQEGGSAGKALHRALERDEDRRNGFNPDPKFYVEPAFKAIGVSAADRAAGATWETANEGRVHVITQDGKASAVPYATLKGRGDSIPAVFHDDDTRAMEKAVQDKINSLPLKERSGQLYAPDVVRTKDGWKVIELNPSAVGGGSDWLGGNPLVIDAVASHVAGREPAHVRFVRDLMDKAAGKKDQPELAGPDFPAPPPIPTSAKEAKATEREHKKDKAESVRRVKGRGSKTDNALLTLAVNVLGREEVEQLLGHSLLREVMRNADPHRDEKGRFVIGDSVKVRGESGYKIFNKFPGAGYGDDKPTYRVEASDGTRTTVEHRHLSEADGTQKQPITPSEPKPEPKHEQKPESKEKTSSKGTGEMVEGKNPDKFRYRYFEDADEAVSPGKYEFGAQKEGHLATSDSPHAWHASGGAGSTLKPYMVEFGYTGKPVRSENGGSVPPPKNSDVKRVFINEDSVNHEKYSDDHQEQLSKLKKQFPRAEFVHVRSHEDGKRFEVVKPGKRAKTDNVLGKEEVELLISDTFRE